jgi:uncharacterized repeat protein (TIGR04138 family)
MDSPEFRSKIRQLVEADPRYHEEAYRFVREGLDYTVKELKKAPEGRIHHVRGNELLQGIRCYAIDQFGPVTLSVLKNWGIARCEDFGEIVFNMVEIGLLGKTDQDDRADFSGVYTFEEAFVIPFLPRSAA